MLVRGFVILYVLMHASIGIMEAASAQLKERKELTISECAAKGGECDESRGRPVCGTDDQTYPTRCHLLRVQCSGHQVSLKYRGPCKACKEARDYALKHRAKNPPKFLPRCKSDGTYAPIQCSIDTGCWCSDLTGKPIQNTTVRIGKPKCREFAKSNIRRSPPRHLSSYRNRRTCYYVDRAAFNANLLKVFQSEYIRSGQHQRDMNVGIDGAGGGVADKLVLDWKFADLDVNANKMLDKNEFRELKKLVKRAVKPRRCGRAFGKFCDVDSDDRLTREEWNSCLSKDGKNGHAVNGHKLTAVSHDAAPDTHGYKHHRNNNKNKANSYQPDYNYNNNHNNHNRHSTYVNHHQIHLSNHHNAIHSSNLNINRNNNNNRHDIHHGLLESESAGDNDESSQHLDYDEDADYDSEDSEDDDNLSMLHTFGSSTNFPSIYFLRPKPESPLKSALKESEGESDCLADQAAALEGQRHGGTTFYVPECTPDGRYQRVQCYRSTPYCWCVHEDTGKNIPGTSVKDKRPQCDTLYAAPRPMEGCPEPKKAAFLKDLKSFLKLQILTGTNAGANTTKWSSEDERIATLSFVLLDKNKNKAWERKEWKTFRELMINSKTLRKCGKKLPRHCDVNSDKKITLSEWLNCLQAQRIELPATQKTTQMSNESVTTKPSKLTGSNPLEQYLKD